MPASAQNTALGLSMPEASGPDYMAKYRKQAMAEIRTERTPRRMAELLFVAGITADLDLPTPVAERAK